MTWRRPSQPLKSPTTETRRAFGAQTAKCTPSTPSMSEQMGAELVEEPEMGALGDVVVVHRPEHRAEDIGIDDAPLPGRFAP